MAELSTILEHGPVRLEPLADHHLEPLRAACAEDQGIWEIYPVSMLDDNFDQAIRTFHDTSNWVRFAVINADTDTLVGMTNYINPDMNTKVTEIGGTYIAPSVRGSGFNGIMKKLMIDHAFAYGFTRIDGGGPETRGFA